MDKKLEEVAAELKQEIEACEYLLIGFGIEWERKGREDIKNVYEALYHLVQNKNYFIITTAVDGEVFKTSLDPNKITAPRGNENWLQCSHSCTKDIWEEGEITGPYCPHCHELLTGNTINAEHYIEEGYLPQWNAYKKWLVDTLNHKLLILELGVGFRAPTVIRWPFEKMVFFNQKSHMFRVNETFPQISGEIKDRAQSVAANSVEFIEKYMHL